MNVFVELAKRYDSSLPRFFYNCIEPHVILSHELFRRSNHMWLVPAVATSFNDGTLNRSVRDVSTVPSQQILHPVDGRKCNVCHIGEDSRRQPSCREQFRHEQLGGWRSR